VPEHEGNGGEQGDNSAKCDVSPRRGRQGGAVEEDVEAIQKVSHLRGAHVEEEWKGIFMEEEGNCVSKMREHVIQSSMG